jgi:hypothetical protein
MGSEELNVQNSCIKEEVNENTLKNSELFISVKFQKLLVSSSTKCLKKHSPEKEKICDQSHSRSEDNLHSLKTNKNTRKKSRSRIILRKSKLGESLKKIQEEKETSVREEDTFGQDFSNSLNDFSRLSLSPEKKETDSPLDFTGESFTSISGCGSKRKRSATPRPDLEQGISVSCSQQASRVPLVGDDVTAEELAAYIEDTIFFPKRMSYMAEMMYT